MNQIKLIVLIVGLAAAVSFGVYVTLDEYKLFTAQQRYDTLIEKQTRLAELDQLSIDTAQNFLRNEVGGQARAVCLKELTLQAQVTCVNDPRLNSQLDRIQVEYAQIQSEIDAMYPGR